MDSSSNDPKRSSITPSRPSKTRLIAGAAVGTLVALYTVAVLTGQIPAERKIDGAHLALLATAAVGMAFIWLWVAEIPSRIEMIDWR